MIEAMWSGLVQVVQWPAIGFLTLGVMVGIWLGAVPGLSGILGLVILIPFTFGMDPVPAFALLIGMYAVITTSDSISSIMLGIPGTAASQATILDGYPLAMQGKADRALAAAFTCSACGGVIGSMFLALSLPLARPLILTFGSPEFFMLGVLALCMVGFLSGNSILKGCLAALIGLLLSMVGYAQVGSVPRYWFGLDYALDGLPMIPIVLGLFAVPEVMELAVRDTSISRIPKEQAEVGGQLAGIRDVLRHRWLVIRCSLIGVYVGMLPGLGAEIVDWIAYGHAVQSAKDKSQFGQGDIRGVIAPESANNALKGAAMIPTLAFGIPGSAPMAIFLGALLIQGLKPGPEMLTTKLDLTFSMVWTLVIANILVAALLMFWSRQVAKVAFLPGHLIVPGVILFVMMGAWLGSSEMGNWFVLIIIGVLGFAMKRCGWPRPPLILGFVLGPIMENAFQLSVRAYGGFHWFLRPVVMVITGFVLLMLYLAVTGVIKKKQTAGTSTGQREEKSALISWLLSALLILVFSAAIFMARDWPSNVRLFPLVVGFPGLLFGLFTLLYDTLELRIEKSNAGGIAALARLTAESTLLVRTAQALAWILGVMAVTFVAGQFVAIPLYIVLYLIVWGGYRWPFALVYGAGGLAILYGFYDQVLHVFFYPSLLFG
ncbi:MAG: tripartite tricarboxylate transporter permease [Pseudomonadota bacterium]